MKRVKGEQLYVFAGDNLAPIGASTDCSLSVKADVVEVSARGRGRWRRFRSGKISWSIDCSGFFYFTPSILAIGQPINIAISVLKRELVDKGVAPNTLATDGEATIHGTAIITDINVNGSNGSLATYRVSFQGSGELLAYANDDEGFPYSIPLIF